MEDRILPRTNGHRIELLDLKVLNLQGIRDVHSFNEDTVILETERSVNHSWGGSSHQ